jgi:Right handed beta helix region
MIRIIAKVFAITVALTTFFQVESALAQFFVGYVSSTGVAGGVCTATEPCSSIYDALHQLEISENRGTIVCLNFPVDVTSGLEITTSVTLDCAGIFEARAPNFAPIHLIGTNQIVTIRNYTISGAFGGYPAIKVAGSGTLILENCAFENLPGTALDVEPNGAFNLIVTNSRISNSVAGIMLKPTTGGSVKATFNGVTIVNNNGGGLKTDSTNGPVSVDISNSTISNNAGNGMNAVSPTGPVLSGGLGGANMFNIRNSVIAGNGSSGIQANGPVSAVLVNNTLLDSNTAATSAINGGRILTYGNNNIVGSAGSGFTGPAPLQ